MKIFKPSMISVAIGMVALSLTACGGGEGNGMTGSVVGGTNTDQIIYTGTSDNVNGTITTDTRKLTGNIKWSIQAENPASEKVIYSNDTCTNTEKSDTTAPTPALSSVSTPNRTGSSSWSCALGVVAPESVASDRRFKATLSGTDDNGNSVSATKYFVIKNNPTPTVKVTSAAGNNFSVTSGQEVNLSCPIKETGSNVQWIVIDNGGKQIVPSSYSGSNIKFTAPAVDKDTNVTMQCKITTPAGLSEISNVTVTINPDVNSALVAGITNTGNLNLKPSASLDLKGEASWYDAKGAKTTGNVITYQWTSTSNLVTFSTPNSINTTLTASGNITTSTYVPVTLTVTSGTKTSKATANILIDPIGSITPSIDPPAQSLKVGDVGKFTVTTGATSGIYYFSQVVSGPAVPLGGVGTNTISFVAPTVTAETRIVIRTCLDNAPISATNPNCKYMTEYTATVFPKTTP